MSWKAQLLPISSEYLPHGLCRVYFAKHRPQGSFWKFRLLWDIARLKGPVHLSDPRSSLPSCSRLRTCRWFFARRTPQLFYTPGIHEITREFNYQEIVASETSGTKASMGGLEMQKIALGLNSMQCKAALLTLSRFFSKRSLAHSCVFTLQPTDRIKSAS